MIPHQELVAALSQWRQGQGLSTHASFESGADVDSEAYNQNALTDEDVDFKDDNHGDVHEDAQDQYASDDLQSVDETSLADDQDDHEMTEHSMDSDRADSQHEDSVAEDGDQIQAQEQDTGSETFNPFNSNTKPGDDSVYKAYEAEGETRAQDMEDASKNYFEEKSTNDDYYDGIEAEEVEAQGEEVAHDAAELPEEESPVDDEPQHPFTDDEDDDFDDDLGEKTSVGEVIDYD